MGNIDKATKSLINGLCSLYTAREGGDIAIVIYSGTQSFVDMFLYLLALTLGTSIGCLQTV